MIARESIPCYQGVSLRRGSNFLYLSPHILLQPYIANYTISFPTSQTMPDEYTVLPTASSTLVISVSADRIVSSLRGVNTKACHVGAYANKMKLLLLIEFHPGRLYPFIGIDQFELVDSSFMLDELDKTLTQALENELMQSEGIETLVAALDRILMARLRDGHTGKGIAAIMRDIVQRHGKISAWELAAESHYSEKQIRRLFLHHVGTSPKLFSRIVRANYALRLLQNKPGCLTDIAAQAGFFDQPHFIHDFKMVCGLTPQEYIRKMSVFYNDRFKM
ncbi:AraC-like DNA-binding protein [Hydrogenispora ethanolica]|uniref:AraC-like DNA-binding protein n=2 Tax=Hydrogenispora ethanolica TaxID=1082276 RepID=A0A4R1RC25_HYDET|nr:AraC-like DNA-binding protein [Hydrogenispora ethanolica]